MTVKHLVVAGALLLLVGALLGLIPGSVSDTFSCGSPWVRDTAMIDAATDGARLGSDLAGAYSGRQFGSPDYHAICANSLDARGIFGGALASLGVLTLLGAALVSSRRAEV